MLKVDVDRYEWEEEEEEKHEEEYEVPDPGGVFDEPPPPEYVEGKCLQCQLRLWGTCCWVFLGFCAFAWTVHSFQIAGSSSISEAPSFSKSLIWRSMAHHTDAWQDWQSSYSPPPPAWVAVAEPVLEQLVGNPVPGVSVG